MGFRVHVRGGGLTMGVDARRVGRAMGEFPDALASAAYKGFRAGGVDWEREVKSRFKGYTGESGSSLQNRSGNLRRTVRYHLLGGSASNASLRKLALVMQVGDNRTPYALAQEFGARIVPRNARALTVPLDDALTPAGVVRGGAVIRKSGGKFVTDDGPTFIHRSGKNAFVAVRGRNGRLKLLYILKQSVTIPGPKTTGTPSRLGAVRTAREITSGKLVRDLSAEAGRILSRGGGRHR